MVGKKYRQAHCAKTRLTEGTGAGMGKRLPLEVNAWKGNSSSKPLFYLKRPDA